MSGARTRRIRRIQDSDELGEFVAKLDAYRAGRDSDWMLRHDTRENPAVWLTTPISSSKMDEPRDESNYETAQQLLNEASGFARRVVYGPDFKFAGYDVKVPPGGYSYLSGGTSERGDAWPGGTISTLLVRADDWGALRCLKQIIDALADYPVLDDEDCSRREWEHDHPSEHECYSDAGDDCPCAVRNHAHIGPGFQPEDADEDGEVYCDRCSEHVVPGTIAGQGNTHGEDDGSNPDQGRLFW